MDGPQLPAQDRHAQLQRTIGAASRTIQAVQQQPGVSPELLTASEGLLRRHTALTKDIASTWESTKAKPGRNSSGLDDLQLRADTLVADANTLWEEATTGTALGQGGQAAIEFNTKELVAARDYHRTFSRWLLVILGVLVGAGGLALWHFFDPAQATVAGKSMWEQLALLLGGRLSAVLLAGWALLFVGRLSQRHARQAVIYQDRLSGMGPAAILLQHGKAAERSNVISSMVEAYLTLNHDAFREPVPEKGYRLGELKRLTKILGRSADRVVDKVLPPR